MGNALLTEKAVLTRKEAWVYCGSRPFFERLEREYPDLVRPIAESKPTQPGRRGKTTFLREVIDTALKRAHLDRVFIDS